MNKKAKKVLVGPLDWGLGHITRTIPIIEKLIERGHDVHTCNKPAAKQQRLECICKACEMSRTIARRSPDRALDKRQKHRASWGPTLNSLTVPVQ